MAAQQRLSRSVNEFPAVYVEMHTFATLHCMDHREEVRGAQPVYVQYIWYNSSICSQYIALLLGIDCRLVGDLDPDDPTLVCLVHPELPIPV